MHPGRYLCGQLTGPVFAYDEYLQILRKKLNQGETTRSGAENKISCELSMHAQVKCYKSAGITDGFRIFCLGRRSRRLFEASAQLIYTMIYINCKEGDDYG